MGLLESSREVLKIAAQIANPELVTAATKANVEALELSAKNMELHKLAGDLLNQVKELQEKLKLSGEVFVEGDFAYREGDQAAYCVRCWDVDRRLVHVIRVAGQRMSGDPGCPECKTRWVMYRPNPRPNTKVSG